MATKKILVCSDSIPRLDQVHTWLHDSPKGYVVIRGDRLEKARTQYEAMGFDLIINAGLHKDGGDEWIASIRERGRLILEVTNSLSENQFLNRVAQLLGD
ncbi:MAG TPA: hypothetical protein VF974_05570 [Patescibacteria group bacterium]